MDKFCSSYLFIQLYGLYHWRCKSISLWTIKKNLLNKLSRPKTRMLAVPTGFEPAISALTGLHVRPLHHGTKRKRVYHTNLNTSSRRIENCYCSAKLTPCKCSGKMSPYEQKSDIQPERNQENVHRSTSTRLSDDEKEV